MEQDRMHLDRDADRERQYTSDIVYPNQVRIKKDSHNILRIVNQDYQKCFASWILCDDGEKRRFIVENQHEGRGILSFVIGDRSNFYRGGILETKKDEHGKKTDAWYSPKDPELMDIVKYNGDRSGKNGNWKAKTEYMFNVIDRSMEPDENGNLVNWCSANKKTKLLIMGSTAFDSLVDTKDNFGPIADYDINYLKKGNDINTKHSIMRAGDAIAGVVIGPLTKEESEYEKWDLKLASKLASATYILKYVRNNISRIVNVMGTDFISQLEAQAEIEKKNWEDKGSSSATFVKNMEGSPVVNGSGNNIPIPDLKQPQTVTRSRVPVATETGGTVECFSCKKKIPENSEVCPYCKTTLMLPCDSCGKLISITATECVCGAKYTLG